MKQLLQAVLVAWLLLHVCLAEPWKIALPGLYSRILQRATLESMLLAPEAM